MSPGPLLVGDYSGSQRKSRRTPFLFPTKISFSPFRVLLVGDGVKPLLFGSLSANHYDHDSETDCAFRTVFGSAAEVFRARKPSRYCSLGYSFVLLSKG